MLLWRDAFEKYLREALGENLELTWTNNRRVMISFMRRRGMPVLRLHESFVTASDGLRSDLVKYLVKSKGNVPNSVREFINATSSEREAKSETGKVKQRGRNYHLGKIYRKLNKIYFDGKLKGRITWGRKFFPKKGKQSITFGSYTAESKLIRINPILDTELVPLFYLESVVHHEMAHEQMDVEEKEKDHGRHHSARFHELERGFKYHELAVAWEKSHLEKLLRYRPKS